MEFITSRGFKLPENKHEIEESDWFNMWMRKEFPYSELFPGDILYWFDTTKQKLVWRTKVVKVERYPYKKKQKIFDQYSNSFGSKYYDSRPDSGYFIGYKVKVLNSLDSPKPPGVRLPQLGWLRVDDQTASSWFGRPTVEETITLDELISNSKATVLERLAQLNEIMKNVSPERIKKIVSTTIRKDTLIVNALKSAAGYRCQFPSCGVQIRKKKNGFYIEVAHISPVSSGGQSVLGNLLVLCPNHHKEFDYGDLKIQKQSNKLLVGELNGNRFAFHFAYQS